MMAKSCDLSNFLSMITISYRLGGGGNTLSLMKGSYSSGL